MGDHSSVFVKDEAIMLRDSDEYGGGGGAGGGGGVYADGFRSSPDTTPPPPFLRKTFEMVEEKETDEIISWSCSRKSFIVFDPFRFSRHLLPKYFKHNNFSSFIRQLNTYGFKKVDSERWEFANDGFQGGQKQLLRNIKRRKQQQFLGIREIDFIKDQLKKDQAELRMEILKMKEQQERTNTILANVGDRVQNCEYKQHKMFLFMAKAFATPLFLRQVIHHLRHTRRQKLMMLPDSQIIRKKRKLIDQEEEELDNMEQEVKIMLDDSMDGQGSSSSSSPDNCEYILWEKLLEDDIIICENNKEAEEEEEVDNYIVRELEDLINQATGF